MAAASSTGGGQVAVLGAKGAGDAGVREIAGYSCTEKATFLHIIEPAPEIGRRRRRSAPPNSSSSSSQSRKSESDSSLLGMMNSLMQDNCGPGDAAADSDMEALMKSSLGPASLDAEENQAENGGGLDAEENQAENGGGGPAQAKKYRRECKGKRDRLKRFVNYVQRTIRADPNVDLTTFDVPTFIRNDARTMHRMMQAIRAFQERARAGTLSPEEGDGGEFGAEGAPAHRAPRASAKRAASPGVHPGEPEPKRAAGPGREPRPRRPGRQMIVSL